MYRVSVMKSSQPKSAPPPLKMTLKMEVGNNQIRLIFSGTRLAAMKKMQSFLKEKLPQDEHYIDSNAKAYLISEYGTGWGMERPDIYFPQEIRLDFWFPNKYRIRGNAQVHANQQVGKLISSVVDTVRLQLSRSSSMKKTDIRDISLVENLQLFSPPELDQGVEIELLLAQKCCLNFLAAIDAFKKFFREEAAVTIIQTYDEAANLKEHQHIKSASLKLSGKLQPTNSPSAFGIVAAKSIPIFKPLRQETIEQSSEQPSELPLFNLL
jgi:hypothetical protein